MEYFPVKEGEKFALLAVTGVRSTIPAGNPVTLPDGTWVLTKVPGVLQGQPRWGEWLGSLRVGRLAKANLVLIRAEGSLKPEILDEEHVRLDNYLTKIFYILRLAVVLEYSGADILVGSLIRSEAQIRQVSEVPGFRPTRGSEFNSVRMSFLEEAVKRAGSLSWMESEFPDYRRVIRGMNTLMDGLRHEHGRDRIHQFVRALEALILPDVARTGRQFVHRCQTFARPGAVAQQALVEAFDMRSDTEHMHDWDSSLQSYPADDRENVALHRTRQMEALACFAYSRVLDDPVVGAHFKDESQQRNFWTALDDAQRREIWGSQIDLATVKIVRSYDQWGRPAIQ